MLTSFALNFHSLTLSVIMYFHSLFHFPAWLFCSFGFPPTSPPHLHFQPVTLTSYIIEERIANRKNWLTHPTCTQLLTSVLHSFTFSLINVDRVFFSVRPPFSLCRFHLSIWKHYFTDSLLSPLCIQFFLLYQIFPKRYNAISPILKTATRKHYYF